MSDAALAPVPITHPLLAGLPHGFFTRRGGVSTGLYDSLNAGPGSADDLAAVAENRARVQRRLGTRDLLSCAQVHSARAVVVEAPFEGRRPEADAMATARPGRGRGALSADCAPVLLADREAGVVAAAHAGWRGALDGVCGGAIDAMIRLGAERDRIFAVVGPCLSLAAYEVGPEFVERFLDDDAENGRFFADGQGDRAMFDLPGYVLARLRAAGVAEAAWTGHCTYADPARFYSHRRARHAGEGDYGRLVSAIALPG
ncbi:MAG: peptidoglycan editing factor PgeF [Paracoccaceae bacterium]